LIFKFLELSFVAGSFLFASLLNKTQSAVHGGLPLFYAMLGKLRGEGNSKSKALGYDAFRFYVFDLPPP